MKLGLKTKALRRVSLLGGLGACEAGIQLSRCPGYVVSGNARGLGVGLMLPEMPLCHSKISLSLTVEGL